MKRKLLDHNRLFFKNFRCCILFLLLPLWLAAQPALQWQKSLGGTAIDRASSINQTIDGGYIIAGGTNSTDGDITGNHGNFDYLVVKLSNTGTIQWQKILGGSNDDEATAIQQTTDGGYIIAGYSGSINGNVSGNHGDIDYWIVKLNSTGNIVWQRSLGGSERDIAQSVQQTSDGGYLIAGSSASSNGNITGHHPGPKVKGTSEVNTDYWLVKLDANGNLQWQRSLGGSKDDAAYSARQTTDGGYMVAGYSESADGDITGNHGGRDYWIVKLGSTGNIQWQKALGGTNDETAYSVYQAIDGGFIIAGNSLSNNGNVSGHHGVNQSTWPCAVTADCWIVKLNNTGVIQWQRSIGGNSSDNAYDVKQVKDGGYLITATTQSNDGDVSGNHGPPNPAFCRTATSYRQDYWLVKLNSVGSIQWQKCLGGSLYDDARCSLLTPDGGFVTVGMSNSTDGDVTGNHENYDAWIAKLNNTSVGNKYAIDNTSFSNNTNAYLLYPNPARDNITFRFTGKALPPGLFLNIYNSDGKILKQVSVLSSSTTISLQDIPPGFYSYQLLGKEILVQAGKIIVQ